MNDLDSLLEILEKETASRYEDLSLLASGGMGLLVKARTRSGGQAVVIKVPRLAGDPLHVREIHARFLREMRAIASLAHPAIVKVIEVEIRQDIPYMVMEFLEGSTLDEHLVHGTGIDIPRLLGMAIDICGALVHMHERGIIHRDLKPANVMLVPGGGPRLIDFGLTRFVDGTTDLTRAGQILGTLVYMAPEQMMGTKVDARADIYSLGAILYRVASGRPPFSQQMAPLKTERMPDPPSRANPDITPRLESLIMATLAMDPAGRPTTALDLKRGLVECFREAMENTHVADAASRELITLPGGPSALPSPPALPRHPLQAGQSRELILLRFCVTWRDRNGDDARPASSRLLCSLAEEATARGATLERFEPAGFLVTLGRRRATGRDVQLATGLGLSLIEHARELGSLLAPPGQRLELCILVNRTAAPIAPWELLEVDPAPGVSATPPGVWVSEDLVPRVEERFHLGVRRAGPPRGWRKVTGLRARTHRRRGPGASALLGREAEFTKLNSWFGSFLKEDAAAPAGGRPSWIAEVRGEVGCGKSALVEAFLSGRQGPAVHIIEGTATPAWPASSGLLASILLDAIDLGPGASRDEKHMRLEALDRRLPEGPDGSAGAGRLDAPLLLLGATPRGAGSAEAPDPLDRDSLVRDAKRFLVRLLDSSGGPPVILRLENLHAADELSLDVLDLVLAESGGIFCFVTDVPPFELSPRWLRRAHHEVLEIGPLGPDTARELLDRQLDGAPIGPQERCEILERSGGIPFYIEEFAQWVLDRRMNSVKGGSLPGSLQELALARLDALSHEERELLQLGAVLGADMEPDVLEVVCHELWGWRPRRIGSILRRLEAAGLLVATGPGRAAARRFRNRAFREAIETVILPANRRILHHVVLRALEGKGAADSILPLLVHHAAGAGDLSGAQERLREAIRVSMARDETRQTMQLLSQAVTMITGSSPEESGFREAVAGLAPAPRRDLIGYLLTLESLLERGGRAREQCDLLQSLQFMRTMEGCEDCAGEVENRLSRRAWLGSGDVATAARHARAALELERQRGSLVGRAEAHRNIGSSASLAGRHGLAIRHHRRAYFLFRSAGHGKGMASALCSMAINCVETGEFEAAAGHLSRALTLSEEPGDRRGMARARRILGDLEHARGRHTDALRHHTASLELEREIGHRPGEALSHGRIASLWSDLGRLEEALEHHRDALAIARSVPAPILMTEAYIGMALAYLARAEAAAHELAAVCAQNGLELARALGNRGLEILAATRRAATCLALGGLDEAETLSRQAAERCSEVAWPRVRPEEIWLVRHQVLTARGDEHEAAIARARAVQLATGRLGRLTDPSDREACREQDRLYRELVPECDIPHA